MRLPTLVLCVVLADTVNLFAEETSPSQQFNAFVKGQAKQLRANDNAPKSMDEWEHRRAELKAALTAAWGGFPETPCDLQPQKIGEIQREGYRVEKLIFQTRPDVWMTANAYVPDKPGPLPAILHVHGHWKGAKQDPVVQYRCIGAAKLGFFVLCVDAFGAGERGIGKKLGEYHGEMVGAMLLPIGRPLSGFQVYENMRAVDYLQSRPEVDPNHIGITGASGGGNQTMYAGAMDERIRCVVPTCSVGNYQAYLSAACCMCEVVPGALEFTEEGDVLGLAAHRGLMVTSATRDAFQFSVDEAKKSLVRVEAIASLFKDSAVKHTIIDSGHDYNQSMREAMYGWMTKNLKREGDGSPIPEPEIKTEDPEDLRCFPGETRPDDFMTIPRYAVTEGQQLIQKLDLPKSPEDWTAIRQRGLTALDMVLGDTPDKTALNAESITSDGGQIERLSFDPEPGLRLTLHRSPVKDATRMAVLLNCDATAEATFASDLAATLRTNGWMVACPELRATGRLAYTSDRIGRAPDHNSAEWSLWIGRPLLGQWVWDIRRALDAIAERDGKLPKQITVIGIREASLPALCAAALDERIGEVVAVDSLASYISDEPYVGQRLGLMAPAILREVGDVADIAALIAPRKATIAGGVLGDGRPRTQNQLKDHFKRTTEVYELIAPETADLFQIVGHDGIADLLR